MRRNDALHLRIGGSFFCCFILRGPQVPLGRGNAFWLQFSSFVRCLFLSRFESVILVPPSREFFFSQILSFSAAQGTRVLRASVLFSFPFQPRLAPSDDFPSFRSHRTVPLSTHRRFFFFSAPNPLKFFFSPPGNMP